MDSRFDSRIQNPFHSEQFATLGASTNLVTTFSVASITTRSTVFTSVWLIRNDHIPVFSRTRSQPWRRCPSFPWKAYTLHISKKSDAIIKKFCGSLSVRIISNQVWMKGISRDSGIGYATAAVQYHRSLVLYFQCCPQTLWASCLRINCIPPRPHKNILCLGREYKFEWMRI